MGDGKATYRICLAKSLPFLFALWEQIRRACVCCTFLYRWTKYHKQGRWEGNVSVAYEAGTSERLGRKRINKEDELGRLKVVDDSVW